MIDHPSVSDRGLVVRIKQGESEAFTALVRRHLRPAVRLAARLLGDDDAAEDVVQDSFVAMLDALDTFDERRPFAPWFYRIVVNRCSNARRSRARRATEPLSPALEAAHPGPDRETDRRVLRGRLEEALAELPARQRDVLMLYDVDGFTGPEIAEMLGISSGTVRWHLHEARAAMRVILEGEGQE
jgi:RNA polymerase sigma factor (sigma-70 family)